MNVFNRRRMETEHVLLEQPFDQDERPKQQFTGHD